LHTQKQNGNQQRRSNVEKNFAPRERLGYGSKKLLAEFPNKAFELMPTVFMMMMMITNLT